MNMETIEKGFTLIELMIVVAIIGILAAIAIPQFASYRVKAFNTAASSDTRSGAMVFESIFTDTSQYPSGNTAVSTGALTLAGTSTMWNLSADVSAGSTGGTSTYVISAKHLGGDRCYTATDSRPSSVELTDPGTKGTALTAVSATVCP